MGLPEGNESNNKGRFSVALVGKGRYKPSGGRTFGLSDVGAAAAHLNRMVASCLDHMEMAKPPGVSVGRRVMPKSTRPFSKGGFGSIARMLVFPTDDLQKEIHKTWSKKLSKIRVHERSWGFAKKKSSVNMCRAHSVYWDAKGGGDVSYLSMDLEGFFPSISGDMVEKSMRAHGFDDQEIERFVTECMVWTGSGEWLISEMIQFMSSESSQNQGPIMGVLASSVASMVTDELVSSSWSPSYVREHEGGSKELESEKRAKDILFGAILGLGPTIRDNTWVLPQGSAVSPPMSNIVCKAMDYRLSAYLAACDCYYTRYADDITISWKGRKTKREISLIFGGVKRIVGNEGFNVNSRKTIIMGPGMRQNILGYNMNSGSPTIPKERRLKIREDVHKLISEKQDSFVEFERGSLKVLGSIEYLSSAHVAESCRLRDMVMTAMMGDQTSGGRPIFILDHSVDHHEDQSHSGSVFIGGWEEAW